MSKKPRFNDQEYISIRTEMIERISLINSQSHTAILTITTAWIGGISLLNYDVKIKINEHIKEFICLNIVRTLIFALIVMYLFPLAVKSGENLIQIASLSAYIRVFYDYMSEYNNFMNWETSNNILSNANVKKGKKFNTITFFNEEYSVLAMISFVFYIIFAFLSLGNINKYTKEYFNVFLIFFSLIGIVCVIAIALIRKSSGMKNTLMKYTPIYVQGYIKRALELGFIKEKDIEHVKKELNPYKEMYILV